MHGSHTRLVRTWPTAQGTRWLGERTEQLGECCGKLTQLGISLSLLGLGLGALRLIDQVTVIEHGAFPRCS
jgi:hypothetical protein